MTEAVPQFFLKKRPQFFLICFVCNENGLNFPHWPLAELPLQMYVQLY